MRENVCLHGEYTITGAQQIADRRLQQTADRRQQTADSRQQTADSRQTVYLHGEHAISGAHDTDPLITYSVSMVLAQCWYGVSMVLAWSYRSVCMVLAQC